MRVLKIWAIEYIESKSGKHVLYTGGNQGGYTFYKTKKYAMRDIARWAKYWKDKLNPRPIRITVNYE